MPPLPENNYQIGPTETFSRSLWNAVFASLAARLAAREALEATFEALIAGGTQAALDVISENVAPQLESLLELVAELRTQVEEVIGSGNAPNALKLGGNLPEFYLALGNATGTLAYNKVAGIDAAIAAAVAGLVNAAPGALDTLGELAAALGNDPNVVTNILAALGNRVRVDAAQALTGPQIVQALDNLGFSTIGKLLKAAATEQAARAAIGAAVASRLVIGLILANNATDAVNDIDIGVGAAQTTALYVANAATLTKRLDAAWAAGNNAGGLDTGAKANSSTYHLWSLRKTSDGSFDATFSLSATAPTVPSGYAAVERIGAVITDAAGAIIPFKQSGNTFFYKTALNDYTGGNRAAAVLTLRIPNGVRTRVILSLYLSLRTPSDSGLLAYVSDGEDITIRHSQFRLISTGLAGDTRMMDGYSNTSRQIGLSIVQEFGSQSGNHELNTYGWEDYQIPRIGA